MFLLLTVVVLAAVSAMGQDLNQECMVMDPSLNKMIPLATQCENKNSDLICEIIMGSVNVTTGSSGPQGYTPEIEQICKEATQDQCQFSITNRPIYAKYCPNTCGFCTMNSCIDAVSVCIKDPLICTAPELKEFAEKYCQRSCGICTK
ncbi:unnamed protein product [Caenorhabditis brenneri]